MSIKEVAVMVSELGKEDQTSQTWTDVEGGKAPRVVHVGSIGEFLIGTSPLAIRHAPDEGLQERWEAQWQEFLKTLQAPDSVWGNPQTSEVIVPWDDAKAFLASFEQVATACRWPRDQWVAVLQPALSGEAEQAFSSLSTRDKGDFEKVKAAILQGEAMVRERERERFRQFCYQDAEGPREVYSQLQQLCLRWLKAERRTKEEILELLIQEQFLTVLPPEMQSWVRERGPQTCSQAVLLAEDFLLKQNALKRDGQMLGYLGKEDVNVTETGQVLLPAIWKWQPCKEAQQREEKALNSLGEAQQLKKAEENLHTGNQERMDLRNAELGKSKTAPQSEHGAKCRSLQEANLEEGMDQALPAVEDKSDQTGNRKHQKPHLSGRRFQWPSELGVPKRARPENECSAGEKVSGLQAPLKEHEAIHTGEKLCKCSGCQKNFAGGTNLFAHEGMQKGEKLYKCFGCERSFDCEALLLNHEVIHADRKPHKRLGCSKSFTEGFKLLAHKRLHKGAKPYQCLQCGKSFRQKGALIMHERIHTGEKPFKCFVCGKRFNQKGNLAIHERIHTGEELYKCAECGKNFHCPSKLVVHERIHTGEKPYQCSKCHKNFTDSSNLIMHKRIHTGEKPFKCLLCGKRFSQKGNLTMHGRIHTGEKPFNCSVCEKRFSQKGNLIKHEKTHNGGKTV